MKTVDYQRFDDAMNGVWHAVTNGKESPSPALMDIFWKAFANVDITDFERAIQAHLLDPKHGMFVPKPADIVRGLQSAHNDDGRPEGDEAWSTALDALDEANTVVWTRETSAAWHAVAAMIESDKDKISARMAFLKIYDRLVSDARKKGEPTEWVKSYGFDTEKRALALEKAARLNRISSKEAVAMIEMSKPLMLTYAGDGQGSEMLRRIAEWRKTHTMSAAEKQAKEHAEFDALAEKGKAAANALLAANQILQSKA